MTSMTNNPILDSIPLNRRFKKYWISKYERIASNSGEDEAGRKFKDLRVVVMTYIADQNRMANLDRYLSSTGFRINGWLRMVFTYADSQPHFILNFLKLYSRDVKSKESAAQAAYKCKKRLEMVKACKSVPRFLQQWCRIVLIDDVIPLSSHWKTAQKDPGNPFHRLACQHSREDWCAYWGYWRRLLRKGWKSEFDLSEVKEVRPEIYKDYDEALKQSKSLDEDFADWVSIHMTDESPLTPELIDFVDGFLDDDVADSLFGALYGNPGPELSDLWAKTTVLSGSYVGHVQHIHKKGGGTELRDIAVPIRFVQMALGPFAQKMYGLVRVLPKDCTFDQSRFDAKITSRVTNPNLYVGTVDLSKATDNLPLNWGTFIADALMMRFGASEEVRLSCELFYTIARANWEDEGYLIRWQVGQPLGSITSFAMLALTHNLFLESLSASLGLMHSPYAILGDDLVVFNRKLRSRYIRDLGSRHIPLSLHKSYEGRLSEFAGKIYITKNIGFFCSDHNPVTFPSLFDWQRSTGIRIPWKNVPRDAKRRLKRMAGDYLKSQMIGPPSDDKINELASSAYAWSLEMEIHGKGCHLYPLMGSDELWTKRCSIYFECRNDEDNSPSSVPWTGISLVCGRPVTLLSTRFTDKDGWFESYRPVKVANWFRDKYRPSTTDAIFKASLEACFQVPFGTPVEDTKGGTSVLLKG